MNINLDEQANAKQSSSPPQGRTIELKVLIVGFLILSALGWLRLQQVIATWDWLGTLGLKISLYYIAISGAIWGCVGLCAALVLWFRRHWAPNFSRVSVLFFLTWYWLDDLLVVQSPTHHSNLPFSIGLSLFSLVYVFGCLELPRQKRYFSDERK